MTGEAHSSLTVGTILVISGLVSYSKTRNNRHLLGGTIIGSTFVIAGSMINNQLEFYGNLLAASASTVFLTGGVSRILATKRPMPGLPMVALGLFSAGYHLNKSNDWKPS